MGRTTEKLASGWGGGMMMMIIEPPPDSQPPPDPDPDPPDTCYTRLTYYVNDQYGSVRAGMSGSTVLTKLEYYPYGEVHSMSGGGQPDHVHGRTAKGFCPT